MSGEIKKYDDGELLYKGGVSREVIAQIQAQTGQEPVIIVVQQPAEVGSRSNEGQTRAIASEVVRENAVNHNGLYFMITLGVAFIVVFSMILVACQHQPIVTTDKHLENCHWMCG